MPQPNVKTRNLTIFLLKEQITDPASAVVDVDRQRRHTFTIADDLRVDLFVKNTFSRTPTWVDFLRPAVDLRDLQNRTTSAVMLLATSSRMFAITFGYGRSLLAPGCYEEGFGSRVSLGAIDPNTIRSIDKKSFDAISQHTRQQTSRGASTSEYGLDVEQDFLRAVTGTPTDPSLGTRMTGMDALAVTLKLNLPALPPLLDRCLGLYASHAYRTNFPEIDQIAEVSDKPLRQTLDAQLIETMRRGDPERLWLAVPEVLDWRDTSGFKYTDRGTEEPHDDIALGDFIESLPRGHNVTLDDLKTRTVRLMNAAAEIVTDRWPVYRCVYFEGRHEGHAYVLNDGKWYRVDPDYLHRVDRDYRALAESSITLPDYDDESEGAYNERAARTVTGLVLMDQRNVRHGQGRSSIEFCDLYSSDQQIIHVKRYGAASVFSHLFAQGITSAELFSSDPEFRMKVNSLLPGSHRLTDPAARLAAETFDVIFAIVSKSRGALDLPLFSKIGLIRAKKRIAGYGYQVHYKVIRVAH